MKRRAAVLTLGCRANQSDGESLEGILSAHGVELVSFDEVADVYVVNSCTVTADADKEARRLIRKAARQNPNALKIVTGCYAQVSPAELAAMPEVDLVVGNSDKARLAGIILESMPKPPPSGALERGGFSADFHNKRSRAYVKIQDGCDFRCSFCIIPFARGKSRSRPIPEIIAEIRSLADKGYCEVVLTGIHIGSFGWDQKPKQTFFDLMLALEMARPIGRIRLSTLDPDEVRREMIELMAEGDLFCPHLHMAIQSGEDSILRRMRRRHTTAQLRDIAGYASGKIPGLGLGADLIAGFPGETEEQHETTRNLLAELPLTYLHVFPYSERKGTAAAEYSEPVPVGERKRRTRELIALGREKKRLFWESQIGLRRKVVLEETVEGGYQKGTTDNFIPLWISGSDRPRGMLQKVALQRFDRGRVVAACV